jgi:hypothetical protein
MSERRNVPEIVIGMLRIASRIPNSDRSPLYDVINPAVASWSDNECEVMFSRTIVMALLFKARLRTSSYDKAALASIGLPSLAGTANEGWWSQTGSNRRPHACKARALPAELWPRNQKTNAFDALAFADATAQQPSFKRACRAEAAEQRRLVGLGRLELPTSRLSSARSNQLSYKPLTLILR